MAEGAAVETPLDVFASAQRAAERSKLRSSEGTGREAEQLRQEAATFEQLRGQDAAWSRLRLSMGWVALCSFVTLSSAAIFVLADHSEFSPNATTAAASTILVQSVGLVAATWRLVLGAGPPRLSPVTVVQLDPDAD